MSPPGTGIPGLSLDDAGRCRNASHGPDSLLYPPAIFGRPILELAIEPEIMGPVMGDVGIELGLPADRDQVGLAIPEDRFGLLRFENDADRHRGNADFVAD